MAIDTSTLEATLQTKFDNVTDPKEMLLLGKAYEATVGGIAVSDIEDAGAAQVATINAVATSTFKTVGGTSILGTGDIPTVPDQSGHSGQFLTTNGSTADWATVDTSIHTAWSQSGNGYIRFKNGFTIQWCEGSASSSENSQTVNYPTAFSSCYRVSVSTRADSSYRDSMWQIYSVGNSSVNVRNNQFGGAGGNTYPVIIAFGHIN